MFLFISNLNFRKRKIFIMENQYKFLLLAITLRKRLKMKKFKFNKIIILSVATVLGLGISVSAATTSWSKVSVNPWGKNTVNYGSPNRKSDERNRTTYVRANSGLPSFQMYEAVVNSSGSFRSDYQPLSYSGHQTGLYSSAHSGYNYYSRIKSNNLEPNRQTVTYNFTTN